MLPKNIAKARTEAADFRTGLTAIECDADLNTLLSVLHTGENPRLAIVIRAADSAGAGTPRRG